MMIRVDVLKPKPTAAGRSLVTVGAIGLLSLLFTTIFFIAPQPAGACRDCPFPMKIGDGQWLMPNKRLEVMILEPVTKDPMALTFLWVNQAETGQTLALGSALHRKGLNDVPLTAHDRDGNEVLVRIHWENGDHAKLRIGFECPKGCLLKEYLD